MRPFRGRIAFTYALTVIEDLLELSYPWATGLAINGLLAQDYRMIAPVMIAWVLHTAIGCGRQSSPTAFNWTAIEGLSILVFLLVRLRVAYMPNADVGTIFAIFVYVWRLMEKLDMMPQIVQQLMRLEDIRRRIEAGASVEAVGGQIGRTGSDKRGPP